VISTVSAAAASCRCCDNILQYSAAPTPALVLLWQHVRPAETSYVCVQLPVTELQCTHAWNSCSGQAVLSLKSCQLLVAPCETLAHDLLPHHKVLQTQCATAACGLCASSVHREHHVHTGSKGRLLRVGCLLINSGIGRWAFSVGVCVFVPVSSNRGRGQQQTMVHSVTSW
jgi:hypothetical protein